VPIYSAGPFSSRELKTTNFYTVHFRTVQHKGIDTTGYRFIGGRMSPDDRSNAEKHQIVNIMKLHPPNARLLTHAIRDILELENRLVLVAADAVILEHPGHCLASASSPCV
jgi:Lhr-like helicase